MVEETIEWPKKRICRPVRINLTITGEPARAFRLLREAGIITSAKSVVVWAILELWEKYGKLLARYETELDEETGYRV